MEKEWGEPKEEGISRRSRSVGTVRLGLVYEEG